MCYLKEDCIGYLPRCENTNNDHLEEHPICFRPTGVHKPDAVLSKSTELLVCLNDLIDTVRNLQYEAQAKKTPGYWHGADVAYGKCAKLLTEIVKAH